MKLGSFKQLLNNNRDKTFRLVLPDQSAVPISFHVTEVAYVQKRFIDCGGKLHTTETCQLQAWEGEDTDHRLFAGRMADILVLARGVLPDEADSQNLDLEVEYEAATISQYPVASYTITDDAVVLNLSYKHTDCLAKESCCPPVRNLAMAPREETACCAGSGCCSE
jgi:hypothetical protein